MEQEFISKFIDNMWKNGHEVSPTIIKLVLSEYTKFRKHVLVNEGSYKELDFGEVKVKARKNSQTFKSDHSYTAKIICNPVRELKDQLISKVNKESTDGNN